jgi:hypothetical protein
MSTCSLWQTIINEKAWELLSLSVQRYRQTPTIQIINNSPRHIIIRLEETGV